MLSRLLPAAALLLALTTWTFGFADDPPAPVPPKGTPKVGPKGKGPGPAAAAAPTALKKYDDVITKEAVTLPGVFAVHRIDDKVYFEIPQSAFGKLMLWQAEVAKAPPGVLLSGHTLGSSVLRWERRANKVYLWKAGFAKRSEGKSVQAAVDAASMDTIIASFPVEAEGKDRSSVILVNPLFTTELADLPIKRAVGGSTGGVDDSRSYLSEVKAFPTNIEVRSVLTFRNAGGGGGGRGGPGGPAGAGGGSTTSATALVHFSLVLLPEKPMRGREFDPRVGYFTESYERYDDAKTWSTRRQFIARFRLEKKDPTAAISEPVTPIVFYLAPEIPEKYRPSFKKGVEDWKPAFEAAGFKDAIICKDAPTRAEDPNWDPEDARYSVIRWVAEPVANAMGPNVHDPRSGEIVSAHIIFWHDILKITQLWYFVECSGVDTKARSLPLPDDLINDLIRYVTTHEVGHTLGLRHNHRASQAYTAAQLRDPAFTAKHGSVGSIMSYGRFNYVAQPEDKVKTLIPVLAPYDIFAISWGYKPIPEAETADAERPTLDEWAARQIKEPLLRFGGEDGPSQVDPSVLTENIGTDAVEATGLGLKNLDRVLDHLMAATTTKGEDYSLLKEAYDAVMTHRRNWFNAVAKQVGGVVENRTLAGRGGETFVRVPKEKQKEAVKFLLEHAFTTPTKLLNPAVIAQFRYSNMAGDVLAQQKALLSNLLSASRLGQLFDAEVTAPDKAYTAVELVNDLQDGIWSELKADAPKIDPLRRNLQREYVALLKEAVEPAAQASGAAASPFFPGESTGLRVSELRAVARTALNDLAKRIEAVLPKVTDVATKAHLEDELSQIHEALDIKKK